MSKIHSSVPVLATLVALTAPAAHAATYIVDRTDDPNISACTSATNDCSLRGAIAAANLSAGADEIRFDAALFPTKKTIKLAGTALPTISGTVDILAPAQGLIIDGNNKSRILAIGAGAKAKLAGLTLINGNALAEVFLPGKGGAIALDQGTLELLNATLSNNKAVDGGAIANSFGTLTINASTLNGNSASGNGGGIRSDTTLGLLGSSTVLLNSTLSGNTAGGFGGGLFNGAGLTEIGSTTITLNVAPSGKGGGVTSAGNVLASTKISNSILAANVGADVGTTVAGVLSLLSGGNNLLGIGNNGLLGFLLGSDLRNIVDAKLGPLADNGGPTQTHALLETSVAIGAGSTQITVDQRGVVRVTADIGSFAAQPVLPVGVSVSPSGPKTYETITATPVISDKNGVTFTYIFNVNGAPRQTGSQNTFDLSKAGNGDKRDVITVDIVAVKSNGQIGRNSNKVTVVNTAPFTFSGSVSTDADTEATFELRAGDADGDPLIFRRAGGPVNGTAEIKIDPADGKQKLFYRSRKFYDGTDFIQFVAEDDEKRTSNVATLAIDLSYEAPKVNRDPVAIDSGLDTYTGKAEVKPLLASDADGDALTYRIVSNAKYGTSELRKDTDGQWKLFYQSLPKYYGPDAVKYVAIDSAGRNSNVATIEINFINRPPTADNAALTVAAGAATAVYIFGNDPDRDDLTFRLVNNPKHGAGQIARDEQGNWRAYYQASAGYSGPDSLTFVTVDRVGRTSNIATVSVTVKPGASAAIMKPAPSGGSS